jgi:UDP-N-acetyl-2-amino-2-deoxyglucuronate dehydrogenase
MSAISVGIVGLGRIGHLFGASSSGDPLSHSAAFAQLDGVTVAWGVDPDPDHRAQFQARFPGARVFAQPAELPDALATAIVSVCSPTHLHAEGVALALRLGARVIVCEKPLAPTSVEARAIVERCRAAGRLLVVNYTRRFAPLVDHLRRQTVAGAALDGPVQAVIRYNGGLVHNGTHWIDLVRAMFGEVIAAATVTRDHLDQDLPRTVALRFASERAVVLVGVPALGYSVGEGEFLGPRGAVRFRDGGATVTLARRIDSPTWPGYFVLGPDEALTTDGLRGHLLELARHAVELARHGGQPRCTGEDGIAALATVEIALA